MKVIQLLTVLLMAFAFIGCSKTEKESNSKRRGADYSLIQADLQLDPAVSEQFKAITDKYDKARKDFRETLGEHPDRVTLFTKYEELQGQQDAEVKALLTEAQYAQYAEFVDKNTRKRPRYNQTLLDSIQAQASLDEKQMQVVKAANDAFEKAYSDAHDIYHGNSELAAKYWNDYDQKRKEAIKSALNEEQYKAFEEVVKDLGPNQK